MLAFQKTIELLLIIFLGVLLQRKINDKQSLTGIKTIILSVALPATIFIALLKIELESSLLLLPCLALCFNLYMLLCARYLSTVFIKAEHASIERTKYLLLPSLAPGLSCFPFLTAYLGDEGLSLAALADVGNKFFGLILLYILAMYWYQKRNKNKGIIKIIS